MSDPIPFDVLRKQVDRAGTRVVDSEATEDTPVASAHAGATSGPEDTPPPVAKKPLKPTQIDDNATASRVRKSSKLAMSLWILFWITLTFLALNHLSAGT